MMGARFFILMWRLCRPATRGLAKNFIATHDGCYDLGYRPALSLQNSCVNPIPCILRHGTYFAQLSSYYLPPIWVGLGLGSASYNGASHVLVKECRIFLCSS